MFIVLAQVAQKPPLTAHFIFIGLIILIFYLFVVKPQKQKQLELQKMIQSLKKNDEVITIGGIHGTVVGVKDRSIILRVADNVRIEVQKSAIAGLKKDKPDVSKEEMGNKS